MASRRLRPMLGRLTPMGRNHPGRFSDRWLINVDREHQYERFPRRAKARPGVGFVMVGRRGSRRGGFFGDVFKGIKKVVSTVAKIPVVSQVAKTALSSIPVVGSVVTALDKVKRSTVLAAVPQLAKLSAAPGPTTPLAVQMAKLPNYGGTKEGISQGYIKPRRKRRKKAKAKKSTRSRRRKTSTRSRRRKGGVSAKQRAARARFARAARKGPIKKGTRL